MESAERLDAPALPNTGRQKVIAPCGRRFVEISMQQGWMQRVPYATVQRVISFAEHKKYPPGTLMPNVPSKTPFVLPA